MIQESERDWKEDFGHENGRYLCNCFKCKEQFFGHKRWLRRRGADESKSQ
ncbi:MAG: hypothetical protein ACREUQ_10230 [Burkholderiales bacterium]